MTCDCGQRGTRQHRTWCASRVAEAEAEYYASLRTALVFYSVCAAGLLYVAYRSEIVSWWLAWRGVVGYALAYGVPVAALVAVAYGRQLLAWWRR